MSIVKYRPILSARHRALLAAAAFGASTPAFAGESPFGFIYTLDLQPTDTWEIEHRSWLQQGQARGKYSYLINRTEVEYGVTDWYQLAFYVNTSYAYAWRNGVDGLTGGPGVYLPENVDPLRSYSRARFDSVSLEHIIKLFNPYTDAIGFGLYFEPTFGPNVREFETKILLQKNFLDDRLVTAANVTFETEHEDYGGDVEKASMINIVVGASYRVADNWMAGIEFRNHREFQGYWLNHPEHSAYFLGPTLHYAARDWWITFSWRHQLPIVQAFSQDQRDVSRAGRIYGDEHARDEFMFRFGRPFGGESHHSDDLLEEG
jgi:hypothetical protein